MGCDQILETYHDRTVLEICEKGRKGDKGDSGGVPDGGLECQILKKNSDLDQDLIWSDLTHSEIIERYQAGEDLSVNLPVSLINGQLFITDTSDDNHFGRYIGFTSEAGLAGSQVRIIRDGKITDASWNFTGGGFVFLGANGALLEADSGDLFMHCVAQVVTNTTITLNRKEAIRRI